MNYCLNGCNVLVKPDRGNLNNFIVEINDRHEEPLDRKEAFDLREQLLNNQVIVDKIQKTIEMYESLNRRHQESYEESNDNSYLNTIARNNEIISELQGILQTKVKRN